MSAVAVTQNELFILSRRHVSELEAVYEISRLAAHATTLEDALTGIHTAALHVKGISRIEFVPGQPLQSILKGSIRVSAQSRGEVLGSAVTELVSDRKKWGDLKVYFELHPVPVESPLRFARFLAEQLANVLLRFHLLAERNSLREKAARFGKIVTRRKAIHRAIAVLIHTHNVTEGEALVLLRRYARQSDHSLLQIAEAIIFGDRQRWRSEPIRFPAKRYRRFRKAVATAAGR